LKTNAWWLYRFFDINLEPSKRKALQAEAQESRYGVGEALIFQFPKNVRSGRVWGSVVGLCLAVWLAACGNIVKGLKTSDLLFPYQWHIKNTGQLTGGVSGEDANVVPVWDTGNRGDAVLVSIVDDGVEFEHPDLSANAASGLSYNYLTGSTDPGGVAAEHGTCVAGVIGARDYNGIGVRGIAPRSSLAGYNMLQSSTVANIVDAMQRNSATASVSNNSWGPVDGTGAFGAPSASWETAVTTAITSGRDGKGTSFFWAAGNGAISESLTLTDRSDYDGYANYYGVTAVAAVGDDGVVASYSEPGANIWISAPSEGSTGNAIYTTDLEGSFGFNTSLSTDLSDRAYTKIFNGTSAATPMVSGVAALMYKANSALTWRDVRAILARTARKNDATNSGWATNGASTPYNISYDYGFGVVDANAAVTMATTWTNLSSLVTFQFPVGSAQSVSTSIPDNNSVGVSDTLTVSGSGISKIEYVAITVGITHSDWGELTIQLNRSGAVTTSSVLTSVHDCYDSSSLPQSTTNCTVSGNSFRFGSARHFGEAANGDWTLVVKDRTTGTTGTFDSWRLTFYGN
jgi:proprotein convertase subtilisin/kexin type 2